MGKRALPYTLTESTAPKDHRKEKPRGQVGAVNRRKQLPMNKKILTQKLEKAESDLRESRRLLRQSEDQQRQEADAAQVKLIESGLIPVRALREMVTDMTYSGGGWEIRLTTGWGRPAIVNAVVKAVTL